MFQVNVDTVLMSQNDRSVESMWGVMWGAEAAGKPLYLKINFAGADIATPHAIPLAPPLRLAAEPILVTGGTQMTMRVDTRRGLARRSTIAVRECWLALLPGSADCFGVNPAPVGLRWSICARRECGGSARVRPQDGSLSGD